MALAYPSGPAVIRLLYIDVHAKQSVKTYVVPTAVWDPAADLWTALETIRDNLVTAINLVTNALLLKSFIVVEEQEDTLLLPAGDQHVNEIASIVCNLDGGEGKKFTFKIPAPVDGLFVGASGKNLDIVDVADVDLNALLDLFQTTGGTFTVSDGEQLADVANPAESGRRLFRKTGAKSQ